MADYVCAIDQGTSSSRVIIFDAAGTVRGAAQQEHRQIFEHPGWVAHNATEIWGNIRKLMVEALAVSKVDPSQVRSIGVTNQRETTVVWDAHTGVPVTDALVWQDTRTQEIVDALAADGGLDRFRESTGLPLNTYFSAPKIRWILEHIPGVRARAEAGDLLFGTIDSWIIWNLTGGPKGGVHVTDVTNASRTLLMDLNTLDWSSEVLEACEIPAGLLPRIVPSSGTVGTVSAVPEYAGVPISGILGDQQAATFGQTAFAEGQAKNTYGTGGFLMVNTGTAPVRSSNGLLTTVAYQLAGEPPVFGLEGSVAVAGSLHHWLRDNLGLFRDSTEIEGLATSVPDTGGAYIVPAFSGLFAPRWKPDARGVIVGLTRFVTRPHLVRAASEAIAFQSAEVIDAAAADTGVALTELRVDGGAAASDFLMQFQADLLGIPVVRPTVLETTALGAAYAAGLAVGVWKSTAELEENWQEDKRFLPNMSEEVRARRRRLWDKAVSRSLAWADEDVAQEKHLDGEQSRG